MREQVSIRRIGCGGGDQSVRRGCCAHLDNCRGWKVSIKSLQGHSNAAILSSTVSEGCRRANLTAPIDWIAALGRSVDCPSQDEKQKQPQTFASRNASPLLAGNRSGCERGSVSCRRAMDSSPAPAPASCRKKKALAAALYLLLPPFYRPPLPGSSSESCPWVGPQLAVARVTAARSARLRVDRSA